MSASDFEKVYQPLVHTSDALAGCVCNGCYKLEVLEQRRRGQLTERYYCKAVQHGYFNPHAISSCPQRVDSAHEAVKRVGWKRLTP